MKSIKEYEQKTIVLFKQNGLYPDVAMQIADACSEADIAYTDKFTDIVISTIYVDHWAKPIQALVAKLANKIKGKHYLNKVIYATNIIHKLDGTLFSNQENMLYPLYQMPTNHRKDRKNYHYVPPQLGYPEDWEDNFTHGPVTLGNVVHQYPQALDALNKLQSIPFKLDPTVILEEERTKDTKYDRYLKVISKYLGKTFYFIWKFDKRGRSYSQGYDINLQSNEYHKAQLSLAFDEVVKDEDALKIAIANHAGHSKLNWEDRIAWFDAQEGVFDTEGFDEPILGRKALRAYESFLEGTPTGYWMSIDATASGLQIMAAISDCEQTAKLVNLINTGKREDVYQMVADEMNKSLNLEDHVSKKEVKKPVMTRFYNSQAMPKKLLNKKQLKAFERVLNGLMPGGMQVMELINLCWDTDKDEFSWTLPDGHVAHCPVVENETVTVKLHEYEFPFTYKKQQGSKNFRSLCPNIIHSIDGWIAREMVRRTKFDLFHIHDCFAFHPNHLEEVKDTYKSILADLNDMDLLGSIVSELLGKNVVCKGTNKLSNEIRKSEYALS